MLLKLCRCGQVTPNRPAVCDVCLETAAQRKREATRYYDNRHRDPRADKFYHSSEWNKARNAYLASIGYICEDCMSEVSQGERAEDDVRAATDVHHEIPIAQDWSLRLAWSNFRGLCDRHHKARRSGRSKGRGG